MPAKRLLGSALPGSRASAARFATVSRPVKASMASDREKTSECHVGAVPRSMPLPKPSAESRKANPSPMIRRCERKARTAMKMAAVYMRARRTRRIPATPSTTKTPMTTSHGESVMASQPRAVPR
jgi:hypothetical protein